MDIELIRQRVQAGMEFLDEKCPWHVERFNPDDFHILCRGYSDDTYLPHRCALILATGMAHWEDACHVVGLEYHGTQVLHLGFYPDVDSPDREAEIEMLNQAWLDAYAARAVTS